MKSPLITNTPSQSSHDGNPPSPAPPTTGMRYMLHSSSSEPQGGYSDTVFNEHESWIRHPKVKENWKIVLASAILSIVGITLLSVALVLAFTPARGYHCLIFGVIGLLCVIPGGYHFIYIYCAATGRPGYDFENLPVLR